MLNNLDLLYWCTVCPIGLSAMPSPQVHRTRLGRLVYKTCPPVERPHGWTV